ncbi:cupin domain-containing protein [Methylococcus sp. EFPC2]|uniref:cupin domain-containing protein n=1 Tax=Methylococcus sp. EFPC2 TaxID=2812648 RepID=UPI001966E9FA|nr:cupin domain-containing protein [Methylococcus sp. EFPC2]QSA98304.1 cupin domain-containing protein [Methylococcus sp. EFPC2]
MKMLFMACPVLLAIAGLGTTSALADDAQAAVPPRQNLLEKQAQFGGVALTTKVAKVVFPEHYKTPLHTHEGPGPRYVVRGRIKIDEGGESRVYGPGEVFWETGQWMYAENVGQGEAELLVIELVAPK